MRYHRLARGGATRGNLVVSWDRNRIITVQPAPVITFGPNHTIPLMSTTRHSNLEVPHQPNATNQQFPERLDIAGQRHGRQPTWPCSTQKLVITSEFLPPHCVRDLSNFRIILKQCLIHDRAHTLLRRNINQRSECDTVDLILRPAIHCLVSSTARAPAVPQVPSLRARTHDLLEMERTRAVEALPTSPRMPPQSPTGRQKANCDMEEQASNSGMTASGTQAKAPVPARPIMRRLKRPHHQSAVKLTLRFCHRPNAWTDPREQHT